MSAPAFALQLAGWAIDAMVASTLLLGAVLLVRVPVRRAFGPGVAYGLWALPALRLVLPPMPAAWREAAATPISRAGETLTVLVIEPAGRVAAAPAESGVSPAMVVAGAWALGAALFLAFHLVRHARFCRRVLGGAEVIERVGGIAVVTSAAAPGPLAFGIWRRYVAFPRDFDERYDADERALALAHELGHHQRGDLLANWLALGVLAVHWFNPLAWHAFHAFRADQELANDARVLAGRGAAMRHAYGRAIVKAAHGGAVSAACHLHTITDLKGRLKMLARSPASRRRLASGATAVGALVVAGLGLTASGSGAAAIAATVKEQVGVPPAPPVPPAPVAPPAPAAPPAVAATPAPPVPPVPVKGRKVKRVVVVKEGKAETYEGADADTYIAEHDLPLPPTPPTPPGASPSVQLLVRNADGLPVAQTRSATTVTARDKGGRVTSYAFNIPDIRHLRCPGGDDAKPVVENSTVDGVQRVVICTNRMNFMARNAEAMARQARSSARINLGMARSAIERDRNLSDTQRRQALAGIAQAEAELSADTDK